MLINLSEVFTLEGKEDLDGPSGMRSYEGADGKYPVASSEPVTVTVKNLGNRGYFNGRDEGHAGDSMCQMSGAGGIHLRNRL